MRSIPRNARIPVWARSRSLAATYEITFVFSSSGYLDVSVHRVPSVHLWIQCTVTKVFSVGFPHSDICGSMCICHSPQLFAAYHVFLRLLVPRHPPCALLRFTTSSSAPLSLVLLSQNSSRFAMTPPRMKAGFHPFVDIALSTLCLLRCFTSSLVFSDVLSIFVD